MKICYIASPSVHIKRWVKYFAENGHEVHLVTSGEPSGVGINGATLHFLKRFGPRRRVVNYLINSVPMLLQFKRLVKSINPDIIHAHYITEIALLGAASGFHPFAVTPWGSDVLISPQKSRMSRWIAKYVLKMADLITSNGEHVSKMLIKLGADPRKISFVYFGVDIRKFKPGEKDESLREKLGILNSPTIISSRRLEQIYDVESLINAVPLVLKEVPAAKFLILGEGSQETRLKELAKSLGVSDSVKFFGWIPEDELPQYLISADIYVSTSLSDGLAMSTMEAMACGLPVIITDFGDNRKWVQDGVNGFIIPLRAPQALASRIIRLLKDEEARKRFGSMNQEIIMERNNWEKEMGKVAKLYAELIEKRKK